MANQNIISAVYKYLVVLILLILCTLFSYNSAISKSHKLQNYDRHLILTNLNQINITNDLTKDKKALKKFIKDKRPRAVFLEQWITLEPHNKRLLKTLRKLTSKYKIKFYLVVGRNAWFGDRGILNTKQSFELYDKYVDGIVLRVEPNRVNVWKDDIGIKTQILNLMLDAYANIYFYAKKRGKSFLVEYPFWFSEFYGPLKSFSQDTCDYADRVIFLIDDPEQLERIKKVEPNWNNVTCMYNINLTKRATRQSEELIKETYNKLKAHLTLYANFGGYIIDSDSTLLMPELPPSYKG